MARKSKKTRPTTATSNITRQLKKGTFATGQAWQKALKSFFGVKGRPLKHKLRSEKARKEFNELVHRYNVERPTIAKEAERRRNIRQKQAETVSRNVPKKQAEKALQSYTKMVDVIEEVYNEVGTSWGSPVIRQLIYDNPDMSPHEIAQFIIEKHNEMINNLPSFAQDPSNKLGEEFVGMMENVIQETETYELKELSKALNAKKRGEKSYKTYLAGLKRRRDNANKKVNAKIEANRTRNGKSRGAGSTRSRRKK